MDADGTVEWKLLRSVKRGFDNVGKKDISKEKIFDQSLGVAEVSAMCVLREFGGRGLLIVLSLFVANKHTQIPHRRSLRMR